MAREGSGIEMEQDFSLGGEEDEVDEDMGDAT